jgi:hypothetical protein
MNNQPKPGDRPGFWRLGYAARRASVTPEAFEAASKAGTIPVRVERLSPKLALVRVEEFNNWLQSKGNNPR